MSSYTNDLYLHPSVFFLACWYMLEIIILLPLFPYWNVFCIYIVLMNTVLMLHLSVLFSSLRRMNTSIHALGIMGHLIHFYVVILISTNMFVETSNLNFMKSVYFEFMMSRLAIVFLFFFRAMFVYVQTQWYPLVLWYIEHQNTVKRRQRIEPVLCELVIDDTCYICLESMRAHQQYVKSAYCVGNHLFHRHCLEKWFQTNPTCPCCRR